MQRKAGAGGSGDAEQVREVAEQGVAGASTRLPFAGQIQRSFGNVDVAGIEAHTDGRAAAAAAETGARAYATGTSVAFAETPDLHTAAHEAAHVVQQRAGVQLAGGVGQSGDAYEQHADAVADRVVAGQSATDLLAGFAGSGGGSAVQAKELPKGRVYSANFNEADIVTGVSPAEETAIQQFRASVVAAMGAWRQRRQTPELEFRTEGTEMSRALTTLRQTLSAQAGVSLVPDSHRAMQEAAQRIRTASYVRFMQEIRAFNRGAIPDYKQLVGFEDIEAEHSYEIQALFSSTTGGAFLGAGAGYDSRELVIYYRSKAFGISWKQTVALQGLKLSYQVNRDTIKGGGLSAGTSVEPPGDPSGATIHPEDAYVPPSFFGTARYSQLGASAKASLSGGIGVGASGGVSGSIMTISSEDRFSLTPVQLQWVSEWLVGGDAGASKNVDEMLPKNGADVDVTPDLTIGGDATTYSAALGRAAELEGSLGEVEDKPGGGFFWTPLHMARIYFHTGSAVLTFNALATLARFAQEVKKRNDQDNMLTDEKIGKMFRIEIAGSYSNRWTSHDDRIQEIDRKKKQTEADRRRREELMLIKQAENEALAFDRAAAMNAGLTVFFSTEEVPRAIKALPPQDQFQVEAPIVEKPGDEFEDLDEDRYAEARVFAKLYYSYGPPGT